MNSLVGVHLDVVTAESIQSSERSARPGRPYNNELRKKTQSPSTESLRLTEGRSFAMVAHSDLILLLYPQYAFLPHLQMEAGGWPF